MQRRNFGKAMRYLVAVCTLVSALGLAACGGDDDSSGDIKSFVATVPLTNSTVAAVQLREIPIANGQVFGGPVGNNPLTLIFTTQTTFSLRQGTSFFLGNVSYGSGGSCTFVITAGGGGALSASTCNLLVAANNAVVGTGQVTGTVTLVLSNGSTSINSNELTATVFLDSDGELFVVNPVTQQQVDMGIQP